MCARTHTHTLCYSIVETSYIFVWGLWALCFCWLLSRTLKRPQSLTVGPFCWEEPLRSFQLHLQDPVILSKSYNGSTKKEHPYATDSKNCVKLVSVGSLSLHIFTHAIKSIQALGLCSLNWDIFYLSTYKFLTEETVTALSLKTSVGWI